MEDSNPAVPCGLVAKSYFNDTYKLIKKVGDTVDEANAVDISETKIAWDSDITFKFSNIDKDLPLNKNYKDIQWIDMKGDEHFIVWMRTAGLPNFRKLWGRIDNGLEAGSY